MIETFHFLRPLWFWALVPFAAFCVIAMRRRAKQNLWRQLVDEDLLPHVVRTLDPWATKIWIPAALLGTGLAIIAMAGPTWEREAVPVFRDQQALVVILDLSASMNAKDIAPSRLRRAKFKIADLLAKRQTGQTALVVYAAYPFVVTPLTTDTATIEAQLNAIETGIMPRQGSNPLAALQMANDLLKQSGVSNGDVLIVTDGISEGAVAPMVDLAKADQLKVSVLGIGTEGGAPIPSGNGNFLKDDTDAEIIVAKLETAPLRALAFGTGGRYETARTDSEEIQTLIADRHALDENSEAADLEGARWREFGPTLLLPLLMIGALTFRRGLLASYLLPLLLLTQHWDAEASPWLTRDQEGQRSFDAERYDEASTVFENEAWKGASSYRDGDFAGTVDHLAKRDDVTSLYNRGNALARLGRYEEALESYENALAQAPEHADAIHNRDLIKALLAQQQQSDEKGEEQQQQQQQQQQDDNSGEQGQQNAQNSDSDGSQQGSDTQQHGDQSQQAEQTDSSDSPSDEQADNDADQASQGEDDSENDADGERAAQTERPGTSDEELAQATEQWLRQIPDDPGGLLRRKFEYQYKRIYGGQPPLGQGW
ncbi:MAG: VWA domain-containing protein [Pseudomonadota bacterium]